MTLGPMVMGPRRSVSAQTREVACAVRVLPGESVADMHVVTHKADTYWRDMDFIS